MPHKGLPRLRTLRQQGCTFVDTLATRPAAIEQPAKQNSC
jgi:hypothetical protein